MGFWCISLKIHNIISIILALLTVFSVSLYMAVIGLGWSSGQ